MNKDPYGQLASALYSSVGKHTRQAIGGVGAVLGTITGTGLKLDDFKHEFQDFMVAELPGVLSVPSSVLTGTTMLEERSVGENKQEPSSNETKIEDSRLSLTLKPGDRVLAVRVNGGNDVVVVCKVVTGNG
ncbi:MULTISPECIES: hypothetical protein [Paenibacillus]|uniref:DUF2577 domain-containing protein n=1 Tax=Paenibacillus albilobatus TaxID=2716884 RepID=A0A920CBL0_9BACL|nr:MULTISPECIES: hypothetical protein [Paenibacillus]GIO32008.1 hypothetical protein J2TS6_31490 [Paenibacillus albilobatus]